MTILQPKFDYDLLEKFDAESLLKTVFHSVYQSNFFPFFSKTEYCESDLRGARVPTDRAYVNDSSTTWTMVRGDWVCKRRRGETKN